MPNDPDDTRYYVRTTPTWLKLGSALFAGLLAAYLQGNYQDAIQARTKGFRDFLLAQLPIGGVQIGLVAAVFIVGTLLYVFRCRRVGLYGLFEIAVGTFIAGYFVLLLPGRPPQNAAAAFSIAGALYIIVRGYDNYYKSLAAGSATARRWNRWFFGRDTDAKL